MNAKHYALSVAVMAATAASAATIDNVVVNQMWPWSTKVAIDYELTCDPGETWDVTLTVKDAQNNDVTGLSNAISGDTDNVSGGARRLVWDPGRSLATGDAPMLSYTLSLSAPLGKKYMIVDLTRDGEGKFSVSYLDEEPSGGFNWYTLSRVFVGKSGGGPSRPHKPDLSTTNGKDEEEQELPQIPFATFPCPAHVRA